MLAALLLTAAACRADIGVIIPSNRQEPDPSVLAIEELEIDAVIDGADAHVSIRQIFRSRSAGILEGTYSFALPSRAVLSQFAVWDGLTRIPGVVLERRRASEIYQDLKWQAIDPGLLQQGEDEGEEARRAALFTARIVPIPAWGGKRVELEYHERIPVENRACFFAIPLQPSAFRLQTVPRVRLSFDLRSRHPVAGFEALAKTYPLKMEEQSETRIRGVFEGRGVALSEDFAVRYALGGTAERLAVSTYRDPVSGEPGVFEATLLLAPDRAAAEPRTITALFDTSLSMQWYKLESEFAALERLLRSLNTQDRFNLILFNSAAEAFRPAPVAAEPSAVEQALQFVRSSRLRGGTNLQAALEAALAQAPAGSHLVIFSDGGPTRGLIQNQKLSAWYEGRWRAGTRPGTYFFAVGDDANLPLARNLARQGGAWEWVRSAEPLDFKWKAFSSKIGRQPVSGLRLSVRPDVTSYVYPLEDTMFGGSEQAWVGQYSKPVRAATFSAGRSSLTAPLPERDLSHPDLPRTWAKARVDALLDKINREGEDQASIDEIIRLARKYNFVTPYTSFLAAPRSLLRPRVIRPGDPVLRVRTDPSIVSVVAVFPFGLVKPLRYLAGEDIWQTRFLAPPDMKDGTHHVRLVLRDKQGRVYRESKSFVIVSKPPDVRVRLNKTRFRPGETVFLQVGASENTRTIVGRMYGAGPVSIKWNPRAGANTGEFVIPAHLAAGRYALTVTAEDFAHNIASREVQIEIQP